MKLRFNIGNGQFPFLQMLLAGLVWLAIISQLMIADVWDETSGWLILGSDPMRSMGVVETLATIWFYQLPLDLYRPIGSSLFILLGKILQNDVVLLRYFNALLLLASAWLMALVLHKDKVAPARILTFYCVFLFSSAAFITAGWSANIFDASCLFFLCAAIWFAQKENLWMASISLAVSVFCKEAYLLFVPLLTLKAYEVYGLNLKKLGAPIACFGVVSAIYWFLRQRYIPVGSEADIHGFDSDLFVGSLLSLLGGFPFQFSKFEPHGLLLWVGLAILAIAIASIRSRLARFAALMTLVLSAFVYWGMFGYQGDTVVSHENFVGRLYLIPYASILYLLCRYSDGRVVLIMALSSLLAGTETFRDHRIFQQVYADIYERAVNTSGTLVVDYPYRELVDPVRDIAIGHFPDAELKILPTSGVLVKRSNE